MVWGVHYCFFYKIWMQVYDPLIHSIIYLTITHLAQLGFIELLTQSLWMTLINSFDTELFIFTKIVGLYSISILKISFNINIFRLQALPIILVVPYNLFYVISCLAEVCLSLEGVEQYREEIECNCYIFNFDRVTHKLNPQSTR